MMEAPTDALDYGGANGTRQAELFRSCNENGLAGFPRLVGCSRSRAGVNL